MDCNPQYLNAPMRPERAYDVQKYGFLLFSLISVLGRPTPDPGPAQIRTTGDRYLKLPERGRPSPRGLPDVLPAAARAVF